MCDLVCMDFSVSIEKWARLAVEETMLCFKPPKQSTKTKPPHSMSTNCKVAFLLSNMAGVGGNGIALVGVLGTDRSWPRGGTCRCTH
jgi:hypothetical protein